MALTEAREISVIRSRDSRKDLNIRFLTVRFGAVFRACQMLLLALLTGQAVGASGLQGTSWVLDRFQSMDDSIGARVPVVPGSYQISFLADGSASLRLNCNQAFGKIQISDASAELAGQMTFGPVAVTRAACAQPDLDDQLVRDLDFVRGYLIREGQLHMSLFADGGVYSWSLVAGSLSADLFPFTPDQGGARVWQVAVQTRLNLRQEASTSSRVVAQLTSGTLLDNLGCDSAGERTWCYVQPLGGGPVGYVAADYLLVATAPDGTFPLRLDESAFRAGMGDFDASGQLRCVLPEEPNRQFCGFSVARAGSGDATLVIHAGQPQERVVYFRLGRPLAVSGSEASGFPEFQYRRQSDTSQLTIDDAQYQVPDAVIYGG